MFKGLRRAFKNVAHGDLEVLVRAATSSDSVPASLDLKKQIARVLVHMGDDGVASRMSHSRYRRVFPQLWKRVNDEGYRLHVLKGLVLLEYLMVVAPPCKVA